MSQNEQKLMQDNTYAYKIGRSAPFTVVYLDIGTQERKTAVTDALNNIINNVYGERTRYGEINPSSQPYRNLLEHVQNGEIFLHASQGHLICLKHALENANTGKELCAEMLESIRSAESSPSSEIVIKGFSCRLVDEWYERGVSYSVGQDGAFYRAAASDGTTFEYDFKPDREKVMSDHADKMAEEDIDRYEAEYGADGYRMFPDAEMRAENIRQRAISHDSTAQEDDQYEDVDAEKVKAEFIRLAAASLYENSTVRNAHENSDKQEFTLETKSALNEYYTRLIAGEETSDFYSVDEIAPIYNKFQRDSGFKAAVFNEVTKVLDKSLTDLENAKRDAAEWGIPFSDRSYDLEEDFDPFSYDGSMSIEDSRKVADANNLHEFMLTYSDELNAASYSREDFRDNFVKRAAEAIREYASEHGDELWYTDILNDNDYLQSVADLVSDSIYNELRERTIDITNSENLEDDEEEMEM